MVKSDPELQWTRTSSEKPARKRHPYFNQVGKATHILACADQPRHPLLLGLRRIVGKASYDRN